jgi:hypothetical protein
MIVDGIRRTGSATSPFRQLEVLQGDNRRVLSTPITKISWDLEFRGGATATPIEQYVFKVDGKIVERFADATALVLKKHHVEIDASVPASELQIYVKKALAIMKGTDQLHVHSGSLPTSAAPAIAPSFVAVDLSKEPSE